jgi:chemotaxis protein MotA
MGFLLGIAVGCVSVFLAMRFLGQNPMMFFDDVAFAVVIGGTLAVALISMPWRFWREIMRHLIGLIIPIPPVSAKRLVNHCLDFISNRNAGSDFKIAIKGLPGTILKEGDELIQLRFSTEEIEQILNERLHQAMLRTNAIAASFRSLSKYPPAFGLIGTVLGLAHLMRGITEGLDPKETGVRMAVALVATLYGLVLANLVVSPISDVIHKKASLAQEQGEIALQTVLLASRKMSILKSQEMLNSFTNPGQRVDYIKRALKIASKSDREAA